MLNIALSISIRRCRLFSESLNLPLLRIDDMAPFILAPSVDDMALLASCDLGA